ncbi:hypothetical protein [Shinella sp.]|uniref:hypothetical protein n=2 Tax=Shinella sp. TaxID=1870904 RepID=UPI004036396F
MVISNFWGGSVGLSSNRPGWMMPTAGDLTIAPAALTPDKFLSWPRAEQVNYINLHGGGPLEIGTPPNGMSVSLADKPTVLLQLPNTPGSAVPGQEFTVSHPARDATPLELATSPSLLDPAVFLAWKREDQVTYLQGKPSPLALGGQNGQPKIFASAVPDVQAGAGVIQRTSGDDQPIPYYHLNGSAAGSPSSIVAASAEALFPSLNGGSTILPVEERPALFDTPPSALGTDAAKRDFVEDFNSWHSAYQLEYIKTHGTNGVISIAGQDGKALLTAFISETKLNKVYILQSLDKNAIATMSKADQVRIPTLQGGAALIEALQLSADVAAQLVKVDALIRLVSVLRPDKVNGTTNKQPSQLMPAADQKPFLDQLELLKKQIGNSGLIAGVDVETKIKDLKDRYDRAFAFFDVKKAAQETAYMNNSDRPDGYTPSDPITIFKDVVSLNGDISGIENGYKIFIAQERRVAELALRRDEVSSITGAKFDVPYLVATLQAMYNLELEAHVVIETEEINQQNALLKTYAAMQDIVNQTLQKFAKADEGGKYVLGIANIDDYKFLTNPERKWDAATNKWIEGPDNFTNAILISMFEDMLGKGQKHPLEKLRSISRPLSDIFDNPPLFVDPQGNTHYTGQDYDLKRLTHPQWSTIGTRLSETVTLINQNSQIKMNDINSLDKQRNRHFELSNNALAKMNEILQNIGRA